jgi:ribose 5-phosphate isomerase B
MSSVGSKRKLWIGSDHAGFELKEKIKKISTLESPKGFDKIEWVDVGTDSLASTDYPVWADKLCQEIIKNKKGEELLSPCGVLICGSGVGVSIQANRYEQIRAVLALREDVAQFSRAHNATNVLCMGGRLLALDEASRILVNWYKTPFDGGRHQARVDMMSQKKV